MTYLRHTMTRLCGLLLAMSLTVQPAIAAGDETMDASLIRLQSHMAQLSQDMDAIQNESDPEKRRGMLRDHMESMHEAMSLMQKEMMPSMRRMHRHKQRPPTALADAPGEYDPEEHMARMEAMMSQMESLMGQMAQHRRALRDSE